MASLTEALETAAVHALFADDLEGGLRVVREYETLRHPVLTLIRWFADEQLDTIAAAGKRAKHLWGLDPPGHPRDILSTVLTEYGNAEMHQRFLHAFDMIFGWWEDNCRAHLPVPVPAAPAALT